MTDIDANDQLTRIYVRLESLRANLRDNGKISEEYVAEYHSIIEPLSRFGLSVDEFMIPYSQLTHRVSSFNIRSAWAHGRGGSRTTYTQLRYVDREFFMAKADALLRYLQILLARPQPKVGFEAPNAN